MNIHEHGVPHSANEIAHNIWQFGFDTALGRKFGCFSCRLRMKRSSNLDIDWSYIAWNVWHAARFCLPAIPSTVKGVFLLNFCIFWSFWDGKDRKNGANISECLHNVTSITSNITLQFGARWLSGRVSDSGARGLGFDTYRRCVVSLSKTLYSPKVLVNYPGSDGSVPTWLKNCWLGR